MVDKFTPVSNYNLLTLGGGGMPVTWPQTAIFVGDTHFGTENADNGNPNDRQAAAINGIASVAFPLGGVCGAPSWVVQIGDWKQEDTDSTDRAQQYYSQYGGLVTTRAHVIDGNHDQNDSRAEIIARYGSLTWGYKWANIWFQAMTENYIAPSDTFPPDPTQIASVKAALLARPASERKVLLVHRALSGGYVNEWLRPDQEYPAGSGTPGTNNPAGTPTDSLTPFNDLLNTVPNLKLVIHGHDHYAQDYLWTGGGFGSCSTRIISPGSVAMAPIIGPYSTTFPEAFVVLRAWSNRIEYACYQFGYSQTGDTYPPGRVWDPGVWLYSGSVSL